MRLKPLTYFIAGAAVALAVHACHARAESFLQAEIGLGAASARDMGDGIWVQKKGVPNSEKLSSPAIVIGLSASLYRASNFDLRGHLDYTYFGSQRASCMCVSDPDYAAGHYTAGRNSFNGSGHVQGISLTFEPGYTYRGVRFSIEAGPWVNWATWHEVAMLGPEGLTPVNASHKTSPQFGWVAGAGAEHGSFGLHYRYYQVREAWNSYPGLVTGAHMLYATWRF